MVLNSCRLFIIISLKKLLYSVNRVKKLAYRSVMVERVDYECDVLTHINADIVWLGEKLRCLVDNISCENLIDKKIGRASCRERV